MTLQMIKDLLHGSKGFSVHMVSGRVIDVPHPDFAALSPSETALAVVGEARVQFLRINQIESVELAESEET